MNDDQTHLGTADFNLPEQLRSVCLELDKRIARLAMLLGLELDEPLDMARLMHHAAFAQSDAGHERRTWDELRGLVMLRDELEQRCVQMVGAVAAGEILLSVEAEMVRQGFPPGADGMDLSGLLGVGTDRVG